MGADLRSVSTASPRPLLGPPRGRPRAGVSASAAHAGTVPVTKRSGKQQRVVHFRFICEPRRGDMPLIRRRLRLPRVRGTNVLRPAARGDATRRAPALGAKWRRSSSSCGNATFRTTKYHLATMTRQQLRSCQKQSYDTNRESLSAKARNRLEQNDRSPISHAPGGGYWRGAQLNRRAPAPRPDEHRGGGATGGRATRARGPLERKFGWVGLIHSVGTEPPNLSFFGVCGPHYIAISSSLISCLARAASDGGGCKG